MKIYISDATHCRIYGIIHIFLGVSIRNSSLQSVEANAFANLPALHDLRLIDGLLTEPPSLQFICKSLIRLDMQRNYISHIDESYFAGCVKLATLCLQKNLLSSMPDISFIARTLMTLNLSENKLGGTYLYFVMSFPRLRAIYLEFNHLTAFCMQQIKHLPLLSSWSLNNNNITFVDFDELQGMPGWLFLSLYNNPLQCDNDKRWNNICGNTTNYNKFKFQVSETSLLCGDHVQVWGFQCANNTGRVYTLNHSETRFSINIFGQITNISVIARLPTTLYNRLLFIW